MTNGHRPTDGDSGSSTNLVLVLCALCVLGFFGGTTSSSDDHSSAKAGDGTHIMEYLSTFGYLPSSSSSSSSSSSANPHHHSMDIQALHSADSINAGIRRLQRFAGLNVTGRLDNTTRKLLDSPRCGVPDEHDTNFAVNPPPPRHRRFIVHKDKWPKLNLTWGLRTVDAPELDVYRVRYVLSKAFEVWSNYSKLTFREVDGHYADISISFYKGPHKNCHFDFDGRGVVLAHAFFPREDGRQTDIHFDADEVWNTLPHAELGNSLDHDEEGTSLFTVAAHEIGHSLGLSHSPVEGSLMFPWYREMKEKINGFHFELPDDDKLGIQSLYGTPEYQQWDRLDRRHYYYNWRNRGGGDGRRFHVPTTTTTTTTTTGRPHYYTPRVPYYPQRPNPLHPKQKPRKEQSSGRRFSTTTTTTTTIRHHHHHHHHHHHSNHHPYHSSDKNGEGVTVRPPPDSCDTSYDAISMIRGELFIFKDAYFWRLGEDRSILQGYPAKITRQWRDLPQNLTHVDAVYETNDQRKLIFFIGRQFYVCPGNLLRCAQGRPLSDLGLDQVDKIDGAMVWGHNGRTYLYSAAIYWCLDEETMRVEPDYPRNISMWSGVDSNIDAVFRWSDGNTYFFKGKGFWRFSDRSMSVHSDKQEPSAPFWMGCKVPRKSNSDRIATRKLPLTQDSSSAAIPRASQLTVSCMVYLIVLMARMLSISSDAQM